MIRWPFLPRRIRGGSSASRSSPAWPHPRRRAPARMAPLRCAPRRGIHRLPGRVRSGGHRHGHANTRRATARSLPPFGALAALVCLAQIGAELHAGIGALHRELHAAATTEQAIMVATLNALLPLRHHRRPRGPAAGDRQHAGAQRHLQERALSATLEHRVLERTGELEEAQRVLQRMWTLGQQISLELDPTRVLERFIDAASDIAHADGVAVGLLAADGIIHVAHARGNIAALAGLAAASRGSRPAWDASFAPAPPWTVKVVAEHLDEVNLPSYERVKSFVGGWCGGVPHLAARRTRRTLAPSCSPSVRRTRVSARRRPWRAWAPLADHRSSPWPLKTPSWWRAAPPGGVALSHPLSRRTRRRVHGPRERPHSRSQRRRARYRGDGS